MISIAPRRVRTGGSAGKHTPPAPERLLLALGADPRFTEAVLGDLVEEYAECAAQRGLAAARLSLAREVARSAPYAVLSGIRYAYRQRPVLLAGYVGAALVATLALATMLASREGAPAELLAGTRGAVVVNDMRPVRLPVRVLDAAGHLMRANGVRYQWTSGVSVAVSPDGVVTCAAAGDATIRATLDHLVTSIALYCRPIRNVWTAESVQLVAGDSARQLPVGAMGMDKQPVALLAGELRSRDSGIVALDGLRIRPLKAGHTVVSLHVGAHEAFAPVDVFEPVRTLTGLRPAQRLVAVSMRLPAGASAVEPLPEGLFWLSILDVTDRRLAPILSVEGDIVCRPALQAGVNETHCRSRGAGASVRVTHPGTTAADVQAVLALEREDTP
jgi:hypothetical protein